jgi:hypothetical protein
VDLMASRCAQLRSRSIVPPDTCSAPAPAGGATRFVSLPLAGSRIVCTGKNIGGGSGRSTPGRTWLRPVPEQAAADLISLGNLGNARTGLLLGLRYDPELFLQAPTPPPLNPGDEMIVPSSGVRV